jgi:hypothetical protein
VILAAVFVAALAGSAAADPADVCAVPAGGTVAVCHSGVEPLCVYGWAGDLHYRTPTC